MRAREPGVDTTLAEADRVVAEIQRADRRLVLVARLSTPGRSQARVAVAHIALVGDTEVVVSRADVRHALPHVTVQVERRATARAGRHQHMLAEGHAGLYREYRGLGIVSAGQAVAVGRASVVELLETMTVRRVHPESEPKRFGAPVDRLVAHVLGVLGDPEVTLTLDVLHRLGVRPEQAGALLRNRGEVAECRSVETRLDGGHSGRTPVDCPR